MHAVLGEVGYQPLIILAFTALGAAAALLGLRFLSRLLESHYRAPLYGAIDNMDQGVVLFSEKREVVFCSRRYREIYGLSPEQVKPGTPIELIQRSLELGFKVPVASHDHVTRAMTGPVTPSDAIHEFSDGRIIAFISRPVPGGGGIATHQDITEKETLHRRHKQQFDIATEERERLQSRDRQFDAVLSHMSEALCFFDEEERLIVSNDRFAEMYNLRPDVIHPGMTLRQVIELRYRAGSLPAMSIDAFYASRAAVNIADTPSDTIVKQTNGRVFVIHHRPMAGGGWIATHSDITEREELNSRLGEQLEIVNQQKLMLHTRNLQFDIAINNITQGLCFFDGDQQLVICNNRYLEMYDLDPVSVLPGITLREIIDLRFKAGSFPAMSQEEYHAWRNKVAVKDGPTDTVVELMDGQIFEIHHRPMPDGGWVATHGDVTQQRRAEEQNRLMVHRLRVAQDELTRAAAAASFESGKILISGQYEPRNSHAPERHIGDGASPRE